MHDLPGSKSIVFIGHGFGRLGWTGVTMEHGYEDARDALMAARASVFSLDVTNADYHSLDAGLQLVSRETGGFFARTHLFTQQAMNRLTSVLAGYYVLFLEQPNVGPACTTSTSASHGGGTVRQDDTRGKARHRRCGEEQLRKRAEIAEHRRSLPRLHIGEPSAHG